MELPSFVFGRCCFMYEIRRIRAVILPFQASFDEVLKNAE